RFRAGFGRAACVGARRDPGRRADLRRRVVAVVSHRTAAAQAACPVAAALESDRLQSGWLISSGPCGARFALQPSAGHVGLVELQAFAWASSATKSSHLLVYPLAGATKRGVDLMQHRQLELDCDAPPYYIVQSCWHIDVERPEDVRWLEIGHLLADRGISAPRSKSRRWNDLL